MRKGPYYSIRTGRHPEGERLDFEMLKRLFLSTYKDFEVRGHFQEYFGFDCVDAGWVPGLAGSDLNAYLLRKLRKDALWPITTHLDAYTEDDLFDVIELLFDHVSKGIDGRYHSFADCGWHYEEFDRAEGAQEFRMAINELIRDYVDGFELSKDGEIVVLPSQETRGLIDTPLPGADPTNVDARVQAATRKFRSRSSSWEDRRDAIRDLADVLEYLRPKIKVVLLNKDEQDLFELANRFGIRHHNEKQLIHYDKPIWLSWMFHYYLATIHASVRLLEKQRQVSTKKLNNS